MAPDVSVIPNVPPALYDHRKPGGHMSRENRPVVYDVAKLERRLAAGEPLRKGEVAALARIGLSTLDDWIRTGRWKPRYTLTLGRHRRFHPDDIRALLAQLREEHGGEEVGPAPTEEQSQPGD